MRRFTTALTILVALFMLTAAAFAECKYDKDKKCCKGTAAAAKDPTAQAVVVDPVCGMDVEVEGSKYSYEYKGKTYHFCNKSCMESFKKDPSKYIGKEKKK